jgi:hypothetical protein
MRRREFIALLGGAAAVEDDALRIVARGEKEDGARAT